MAFNLAAPPETLDDDPPLRELMTRHLVGVSTDASLQIVIRLLASTRVRHLPVMEGERCVGLLFEHDAVRALGEHAAQAPEPLAAQLCRAVPVFSPEDRRSAAVRRMARTGLDAVLVLRDGKVLGIVTATDVVRSLGKARAVPRRRPRSLARGHQLAASGDKRPKPIGATFSSVRDPLHHSFDV